MPERITDLEFRLSQIESELSSLPKATGLNRQIGSVKWSLYSERRRIYQRIARQRGTHTHTEWLSILAKQQRRCAKCGNTAKLTKDHILPISRGGSDAAGNLQGLCGPCNSRKGARHA